MPNFGFIIDNSKCIGCHACSTACKSENEVPLGVNRTWVKYVETGAFPDTRRHFQVTRCNHCANPPCARICPVTAMYQRPDGIVEFDAELCIGCKACMQACPYDAIYMDPDTGTAAKCHYCAHRTDIGLEPACVVVCPVHAIIAGDMDDPVSEISRTLASNRVTVRKPEQGTAPKLFYIEGNDVALHPTAVERDPQTFMWADVLPVTGGAAPGNGHASRDGQPQGLPNQGPIQLGGRMAEHMVQVAYNAQHKIPWHWPVPAYLVTKGIGAGIFMLLSLGSILNLFSFDGPTYLIGGLLSLLFIAITTGLLIYDLDRPERFFSILIRPQWRSWLARGAYILVGFSAITGLWWLVEAFAGGLSSGFVETIRSIAMIVGLPLAAGVAVYTAFLFGQAEGRDLWQSSLLPIHLLAQALMVGSGALLIVDLFAAVPAAIVDTVRLTFIAAVIIDLLMTLFGEFGMPHASGDAVKAAHSISHGRYKRHFWWGSILIGHILPMLLFMGGPLDTVVGPVLLAVAGLAAAIGLYLFEYAFVMAPQEIANS
jgi:Fe-S-cluster-containing dehydrogenase component/formate-dependent nitrite reductase membrane component NrfD